MFEIREASPQPAAVKRAATPATELGSVIDQTFPALFGRLAELGVTPAGPPFVRYLETGDDLEGELGVPVSDDLDLDGVEQSTLPGGRLAVWRHVGPYSELRAACEQLERAVAQAGEEPAGPFWESYVTDPAEEPDASKRVTEIYQPLH